MTALIEYKEGPVRRSVAKVLSKVDNYTVIVNGLLLALSLDTNYGLSGRIFKLIAYYVEDMQKITRKIGNLIDDIPIKRIAKDRS